MGCTSKSTQAKLGVSWTQRKFLVEALSVLPATQVQLAEASIRDALSMCFVSTGRCLELSLSDIIHLQS